MSYEILVATDTDEERAGAQAETVLDLPEGSQDVHVTVFHVFTDNPQGASVTQLETARLLRDRFEEAGYEVTLDESSGDPVTEIVRSTPTASAWPAASGPPRGRCCSAASPRG